MDQVARHQPQPKCDLCPPDDARPAGPALYGGKPVCRECADLMRAIGSVNLWEPAA